MAGGSFSQVLLFHWRSEEAGPLIAALRTAGYAALYNPEATKPPKLREIEEAGVAAVVIDLSRLPSHGRYVAAWLRGSKRTRHLPLVFIGGDADKVDAIRKHIPDAAYTSVKGVGTALKTALRNPPREPVVPKGMMETAPGRTNAQKLGIREGAVVRVIDPPADYVRVIGLLPASVTFEEGLSGAAAVSLWFVRQASECEAALPVQRKHAATSRLWILWRKGGRDGLNGNIIREAALALGLVDYNICSLDPAWSGMEFAVKKERRL